MDHQRHDSKMMWGMMLACALPILLTSIGSSGRNNPIVWAVVGLGLMVLLHWLVMRKHGKGGAAGHEHHPDNAKHDEHTHGKENPPFH